MKKFIDQLNAIARKHNIAASVVTDAAINAYAAKCADTQAPAITLPVPATPVAVATADIAANESAAIATIEDLRPYAEPPLEDDACRFKVGSIYAAGKREFHYTNNGTTEVVTKVLRSPIKIVKCTEKYVTFVRVRPRDLTPYDNEKVHRVKLYIDDNNKAHFCTGRGQWEFHYYASDVITDPSEIDPSEI